MKYVARLQEFSLKRLALLTLFLGSPWLFPQVAESQSTSVTFDGTVAPACSIDSSTTGTMGLSSSSILSTKGNGGSAATITVSCNSWTNVSIDSIFTEGRYPISSATVTVTDPDGAFMVSATDPGDTLPQTSASPYPISPAPFSAGQFLVDLELVNEPSIQAGTYSYTVGITFAPF